MYFTRSPVFNVFMGDGVFWSSKAINEPFPRQWSSIKLSYFYWAPSDNFKIAVTIHLPAERRLTHHVHAMVKSSICWRLVTVLHNKSTIGYRLPKYNPRIVIQLLINIHRNLEAYVFISLRSWRYCELVEWDLAAKPPSAHQPFITPSTSFFLHPRFIPYHPISLIPLPAFRPSTIPFDSSSCPSLRSSLSPSIRWFVYLKGWLVIAIAKCQRAKILPIRACCSICSEMSWITVIYKNTGCRLVVFPSWNSLMHYTYMHVFARKQCFLCSALRYKSYLLLPYVTSLRSDSFSLGTFAHGLIMLRLAASRLREAARGQLSLTNWSQLTV